MKNMTRLITSFVVGTLLASALLVAGCEKTQTPVEPQFKSYPPNIGSEYLKVYTREMAVVYNKAAEKAGNGEFKDLASARDYVTEHLQIVRERAFFPIADKLETVNGKRWDNQTAKLIFEEISKGFKDHEQRY